MKAILILLLMLVLTGCGADVEETKIPTTEPLAAVTEPSGSYQPDSTLEMFTEGAVRAYPQEIPGIYAIASAGSDVLVFSGKENTTLTRLTGENLFRIAERTVDLHLNPEDPSLLITADRMVYFDENTRELVWLDESFREFSRLQLPEDLQGTPVITADRLKVWYATAEGVRVMDAETGISRLVKQISREGQAVTGLLMGDSVVELTGDTTLYLDAATGELLEEVDSNPALYSNEELYWGSLDGVPVFGRTDGPTRQLYPQEGETVFLQEAAAAVNYGQTGDRWRLDCYGLASGLRACSVFLPEWVTPWQYTVDSEKARLYFLYYGQAESLILCRWDLDMSQTGDETDYSGIYYTRENPDAEGLARCAAGAAELSTRFGAEIRIYADALEFENPAYSAELCWQANETEAMLNSLENLLTALPEDFLPKTMETMGGKLYIHFLGNVNGPEADLGAAFWDNQDARILLATGEHLPSAFFHGLYHAMETRILSRSIALYRWDELNPKGFTYGSTEGGEYIDDDTTRAFIDAYAMASSREDQARIFEFACQEGKEDFFRSAIMQKKLKAICTGIREAYGLKKSSDVFLWEQYLESPLAYTKK